MSYALFFTTLILLLLYITLYDTHFIILSLETGG